MTDSAARRASFVLYGIIILFTFLRYFGQHLPAPWSFVQWLSLPAWYLVPWMLAVALNLALATRPEKILQIFSRRAFLIGSAIVVAGLLWFLRFDSFLYGGGNMRVAQLSQGGAIAVRWFEFGSVLLAKWLYGLFRALSFEPNDAGWAAWRTFAYLATIGSACCSWLIARRLSSHLAERALLFALIFFGPQALLLFGFAGLEPVVVVFSHLFLLMTLRAVDDFTGKNLASVWAVAMTALCFHISLAFLLPAAFLITLSGSRKGISRPAVGMVGAGLVLVALITAFYYGASSSLEFRMHLIFLSGRPPMTWYGLFSLQHLSDIVQMLFLAAPLFVVMAYLRVTSHFDDKVRLLIYTSGTAAIGSMIAFFIQDPLNGAPFDYPRFTAYLAGTSSCLALLIAKSKERDGYLKKLLPAAAIFAFLLPFATLPTYVRIAQSEPYLTEYLNTHDYLFRQACYSYRDAYFGRKGLGQSQIDQANRWESLLPNRSVDYLTYRGSVFLVARHEESQEALKQLGLLIAKDPFWCEPRIILSIVQLNLRQFDRAKAQIDTCLMIEPYNVTHHMKLYGYYRDAGNLPAALESVQKARRLFPYNGEIATDEMLISFRSGDNNRALRLADSLITVLPGLPFPYLIRAFSEDHSGRLTEALNDYQTFLTKQKDQPETLQVQQRISQIKAQSSGH